MRGDARDLLAERLPGADGGASADDRLARGEGAQAERRGVRVAEHDRDRVEGRAQLRGHDLRHRGLEPLPL